MRTGTIKELYELIEVPLKRPELYNKLGVDPPKAIMLIWCNWDRKNVLN